MNTLDDYLAQTQFVETPAQKKAKLNEAVLMMGLGLLGTRKGQELPAIGRAGLLGVTAFNQAGRDNATEAIRLAAARNQAMQAYQTQQAILEQERLRPLMQRAVQESTIPGSPAIPAMGPPIPEGILGRTPGEMAPSAPARPPSFDFAGYANRIAPINPQAAMQIQQGLAKESPLAKVNILEASDASREEFRRTGDPTVLRPREKPPETIKMSDGRFEWLANKATGEQVGPKVPLQMSAAEAARLGIDRERLNWDKNKPEKAEKPTDPQRTAQGFLVRMEATDKIIGKIENDGKGYTPGFGSAYVQSMGKLPVLGPVAGAVTGAIGNAVTPQMQMYQQAQDDWIRAKLRKESGAVISPEEMEGERRTYFPQPGDGAAVIKQKAQARKLAQQQMQIMAGMREGEKGNSDPLGIR